MEIDGDSVAGFPYCRATSPCNRPGVDIRDGDELLAVNGTAVGGPVTAGELLVNLADQEVGSVYCGSCRGDRGIAAEYGAQRRREDSRVRLRFERAAVGPIPLIKTCLGEDGSLIRLATKAGARGFVIEGAGSGNTPPDLLAASADAIKVCVWGSMRKSRRCS